MTTEDHTEREGATGRRPLRAHARGVVDRALLGAATRRGAEAEHRASWLCAADSRGLSTAPARAVKSATKAHFCTRDRRILHLVLLSGAFLSSVVLANGVTAAFGLVPAGFGLTVTAGTYAAGLALAVRDAVQDTAGAWLAVALVVVGCVASALLADGRIALASGVAFLLGELLDMTVYIPLRRRGRRRAVALSNTVGAVADTVAFLLVAGFPLTGASLGGQLLVKAVWVTGVYLVVVEVARRALPRDRVVEAGV
jgi:queuosine precursor transporter